MVMARQVTTLLVLAAVASLARAQDAEAVCRRLDAGAKTTRLVTVRSQEKTIGYLPAGVAVVDGEGKEAKLTIQPVDGEVVLVSGYLGLSADAAELTDLARRARGALGDSYRLTPVSVGSFECWLKVRGKTVWHQPSGDGPIRPLPFQALAPRAKDAPREGTLITLVTWTERQPRLGVKLTIDWKKAQKILRKEVEATGWLTDKRLDHLAEQARQERCVTIEWQGEVETEKMWCQVRLVVVDAIKRRLLTVDEPRPEKELERAEGKNAQRTGQGEKTLAITYRLRTEARTKTNRETLDLSASRDVERKVLLTGQVRLE